MRRRLSLFLLLVLVCTAVTGLAQESAPAQKDQSAYVPVHKFDPKRDAAADINLAVAEAQRTGKRIIVDVGGDWCQYCHQMDDFFREQTAIRELRDRNFIVVNVYYGTDDKNEKALSPYSKVLGVPHFFVLDKDGHLLHSQHVLDLRVGANYDPVKMKEFLTKWAPSEAELKAENH